MIDEWDWSNEWLSDRDYIQIAHTSNTTPHRHVAEWQQMRCNAEMLPSRQTDINITQSMLISDVY